MLKRLQHDKTRIFRSSCAIALALLFSVSRLQPAIAQSPHSAELSETEISQTQSDASAASIDIKDIEENILKTSCSELAAAASLIMQSRQSKSHIADVMRAIDTSMASAFFKTRLRQLVLEAFEIPRFENYEQQRIVIAQFTKRSTTDCFVDDTQVLLPFLNETTTKSSRNAKSM
jgi:hypothetical protein